MTQNYLKQLCPHCFEVANYQPNPQRVYECKCGASTTESTLVTAIDTDLILDEVRRLVELAGRYPSVMSLQLEHKVRLQNPLS